LKILKRRTLEFSALAFTKSLAPINVWATTGSEDAIRFVVSNVAGLEEALQEVNRKKRGGTIFLANGTYKISRTLEVLSPHLTIRSLSGHRDLVILQGDERFPTNAIGNLINVSAPYFSLLSLTLQRAGNHLIQIRGENRADYVRVIDCILRDSWQQLFKITKGSAGQQSSFGVIEQCDFHYTAGIGPQLYIGGVDAHGASHWIIRRNEFRNIASPSSRVAQHAIHFWADSSENLVEQNLIIDCDRGIGFGLRGQPAKGGIIRNNVIFHASNSHPAADVGISLEECSGAKVLHNTVFQEHRYPSNIEIRFHSAATNLIANNLTNGKIHLKSNGNAELVSNVHRAERSWFLAPSQGDLRLRLGVAHQVNLGMKLPDVSHDYYGAERANPKFSTVGAHEIR
jgi:Right handed beta helix region